ncbi:uncharacterized protein isoform X1 [Danio rerio]|uniref:Si:dkeyp-80c12.8 n=2 Tax=Danio rerio TaxID=7955 RepID=A0A8M1P827_DANRE|nr:uncharacterized protein LOC107963954 precursor [Danio rerio]XP_021332487.1 uncharacterized protein [Danio rerio]|eukprot:NP_001313481.1 uncharacterized protein precursor [Danio rerio]
MKKLCAVCILVIFTHDLARVSYTVMALKCNLCISKGTSLQCTPSVQTCFGSFDVCTHIQLRPQILGSASIRSCMTRSFCLIYTLNEDVNATCCNTDLCN